MFWVLKNTKIFLKIALVDSFVVRFKYDFVHLIYLRRVRAAETRRRFISRFWRWSLDCGPYRNIWKKKTFYSEELELKPGVILYRF